MRKNLFLNQTCSNFGESETAFNELEELATQGGKPPFCFYFVVLSTYAVLYLACKIYSLHLNWLRFKASKGREPSGLQVAQRPLPPPLPFLSLSPRVVMNLYLPAKSARTFKAEHYCFINLMAARNLAHSVSLRIKMRIVMAVLVIIHNLNEINAKVN